LLRRLTLGMLPVLFMSVRRRKRGEEKKSRIAIGFVEYRVLDWMEFFGFRSTRLVDQNLFHSPRSPTLLLVDFRSLVPRPPPLPPNTPRSPSLSYSRLASFSSRVANVRRRACLPPSKERYPPILQVPWPLFSSFPLPLSAVVHWLASLRATIYLHQEGEKIELPLLSRFRKEIRSIPSDNRLAFPPGFRSSILREDTHVLRVSLTCEETPHRLSTICRPKTLSFASGRLRRLTRLSSGAFGAEIRVAF